jgi:hypothetical protein
VSERLCRTEDALTASEAFLRGAGSDMQPVAVTECRASDEAPGPVTRETIAQCRRSVEQDLEKRSAERWGEG